MPRDGSAEAVTYAIRNRRGLILNDTTAWVPISGQYLAQGDEKYLLLGNLGKEKAITEMVPWSEPGGSFSYYFIDDVSVIACDQSSLEDSHNDTTICAGTALTLRGQDDANSHRWLERDAGQSIITAEGGRYVLNNHYDCRVEQQIWTITTLDCDCHLTIQNPLLSGSNLKIIPSLNVMSYTFYLTDAIGNKITATNESFGSINALPPSSGPYFWKADLVCRQHNDLTFGKTVKGKLMIQ